MELDHAKYFENYETNWSLEIHTKMKSLLYWSLLIIGLFAILVLSYILKQISKGPKDMF